LLNVPLPGGDVSIHKTARIALSYLHTLDIPWDVDIPSVAYISQEEKSIVQNMIGNHINTPLTSSMGRLFDAVSSLVGIRHEVNYEGQGAIELENRTDLHENGLYGFSIDGNIINLNSMVNSIIRDYRDKTPVSTISARFHNTLVELCLELCLEIQHSTGIGFVALSGGVWQNRILFNRVTQKIRENGLTILSHHQVPCNDGCISLGQVLVASSVS
jgi:hydrogenase maturation protein HypF